MIRHGPLCTQKVFCFGPFVIRVLRSRRRYGRLCASAIICKQPCRNQHCKSRRLLWKRVRTQWCTKLGDTTRPWSRGRDLVPSGTESRYRLLKNGRICGTFFDKKIFDTKYHYFPAASGERQWLGKPGVFGQNCFFTFFVRPSFFHSTKKKFDQVVFR